MTACLILSAGVGLATTVLSPFWVLPILRRRGVVDLPNMRSAHNVATPIGGGLAVLAGLAAGALVATICGTGLGTAGWIVLAGALLLGMVGFTDDISEISVKARLLFQYGISAALAAALSGFVGLPVAAALLLGFAGIFTVNTANFMDGVNGISTFHGIVLGAYAAVVAAVLQPLQDPTLLVLGTLVATAFLGFLPWNFPKARLFLGDVGSYALGALYFGVGLLLWGATRSLLVAVAPILIYSVDVLVTLIVRAVRGRSLTEAHSDHCYQRLRRATGSHAAPALTAALSSAAVCGAALAAQVGVIPFVAGWGIASVVSILYVAVGYVRGVPHQQTLEA